MENEIIQQLDVIAKNIQALAEPKFIEYIALIFSFIGIIVSGIAIWFAVQVPKKIADRQDNIALFEKRYDFYKMLVSCISFSENLKSPDINDVNRYDKVYNSFIACFSDNEYNNFNIPKALEKIVITLKQGFFLVQLDKKDEENIANSCYVLSLIIQYVDNELIEDCITKYCKYMDCLQKDAIPKLEKVLDIKSR